MLSSDSHPTSQLSRQARLEPGAESQRLHHAISGGPEHGKQRVSTTAFHSSAQGDPVKLGPSRSLSG